MSHTDVQCAINSTKPVSLSGTVVSIGPSLTTGNYGFVVRAQRGGTQSVEKKHGTDFSITVQHTVEERLSKLFLSQFFFFS